jgi:hypothetical protein
MKKGVGEGRSGHDWAHVTPNHDVGGFEGEDDGCRLGARTVEVEELPSSGPAGVSGSLGPGTSEGGGVSGARLPSAGSAVVKDAENMVSGFSPARLMPRRGLDAGRVRTNASA